MLRKLSKTEIQMNGKQLDSQFYDFNLSITFQIAFEAFLTAHLSKIPLATLLKLLSINRTISNFISESISQRACAQYFQIRKLTQSNWGEEFRNLCQWASTKTNPNTGTFFQIQSMRRFCSLNV